LSRRSSLSIDDERRRMSRRSSMSIEDERRRMSRRSSLASGREQRRRRACQLLALAALAVVASCAKAAPTLPAPAPGAPRFADFIYPAAAPDLATLQVVNQHGAAWQVLQTGDLRSAEREFNAVLKQAPDFYPAEAGLGYTGLARKDAAAAVTHFDKALARNPAYAPALAGKGEALLTLGRTDAALEAFEAAIAADASLTPLRSRVEVLKFREVQRHIESARKAAEAGKLEDARQGYLAAIATSPLSAFLYRELAAIEHKSGDSRSAMVHAEQAAGLDPSDTRALLLIAEIREASGEWTKAADAYAAVNAVEPSEAIALKVDRMREKAAFDAMPAEYRAIDTAPAVTRAQLAALLGVRLEALLRRARASSTGVITDVRGHWALPWIHAVTRAGVMESFPNHTFQPGGTVRRGDLAQAVSRVLALIATEKPRLAGRWRDSRPRFSDVAPSHLNYPAVARSVSAGILAPLEAEAFQPARTVSGAEALDAVSKLEALYRK
jgi:tetratricopeptide (TPR) repeat protein